MRLLIHDLSETDAHALAGRIGADVTLGGEEVDWLGCQGCFGCWTKTPGRCVMRDGIGDMGALLASVDDLVIASRLSYGGFSAVTKRALDRSIPYLSPFFRTVGGEMHHQRRHANRISLHALFHGPLTDEAADIARGIVQANAVNLAADVAEVRFATDTTALVSGDYLEPPFATEKTGDAAEKAVAGGRVPSDPSVPMPASDDRGDRKALLLGCSPKAQGGASGFLAEQLAGLLGERGVVTSQGQVRRMSLAGSHGPARHVPADIVPDPAEVLSADMVAFVFPLYVDGLPSHLVAYLDELTDALRDATTSGGAERSKTPADASPTRPIVYGIVNLGFYESCQGSLALRVLGEWCAENGLAWGGGVSIGAGGMLQGLADVPADKGPRAPVTAALSSLAQDMSAGTSHGVSLVKPGIPRLAYQEAAHLGWRMQGRSNGLSRHKLDATPTDWSSVGVEGKTA